VPQGSHWPKGREGQPDDPGDREARPSQKTCRLRKRTSSLSRKEDALAPNRLRPVIAALAAVVLLALSAAPAMAAHLRVEGPRSSVWQAPTKPFVGTIQGHTTKQQTALGSLITASRKKPFQLGLTWSDCCGGGWSGFFVNSLDHVTPPVTAFWAFKLNNVLASSGLGSTVVTKNSSVLVYYTTYNPDTGATQPTLDLKSSTNRPAVGAPVTFTVTQYNDAGTASAAAGASVWLNGVAHHVNARGKLTFRFTRGRFSARATEPGAIRSQRLWVSAS
jgi:hypothetical protein